MNGLPGMKPVVVDRAVMDRAYNLHGDAAAELGYFLGNARAIDWVIELITTTHGDPGLLREEPFDVNDVDAVLNFMSHLNAYAGGVSEYVSCMYAAGVFTTDDE